MLNANGTLMLSMPAHSPHIYLINVSLAKFYENTDKNDLAIKLYKEVINKTGGCFHYFLYASKSQHISLKHKDKLVQFLLI